MLLELQNLGKSFGEHEVLRDVNAGVERGDRIGIIGANGTGKTTLLRILCGESLPDAGDAAFGTGVTTGYLEQNARLDPSLDIYATMRLVFTPALDAMQKGARAILDVGGIGTEAGKKAFGRLEDVMRETRASPGGAADLLAAALFLDRAAIQ